MKDVRARIREQADNSVNGWMRLPVPRMLSSNGYLRVPRGAFEHWALERAGIEYRAFPWEPVCSSGMKLPGDSAYHTDWLLGSDLPEETIFLSCRHSMGEALNDAAYKELENVQRKLLGYESAVLLDGPDTECRVFIPENPEDPLPPYDDYPPALVIPHAGPEWLNSAYEALEAGGTVIVERGGAMAHLVCLLRAESSGAMMRVENARAMLENGTLITVSPSSGNVLITEAEYGSAPAFG